jgi:fatty acid desaturase/cytochrome b involved in lipid metabolism
MPSRTQTATLLQPHAKAHPKALPSSSPLVVHESYAPLDCSQGRGKGFPSIFKANPKEKQFRWEEVAQHNTESSAWVYIGNQVYDITKWLDRHPGGKEVLLLCAGRDISDLFITYHPFTDRAAEVLGKYKIGEVSTTEFPQFAPDRGFYQECRQQVGEYFRKNKLDHKDPRPGLWRLAVFLSLAALMFVVLAQGQAWSWPVRIAAALLFGVCQAMPLLHTMHDASHLSIGSSPKGWRLLGRLCMDWFAGASIYSWYNQHTIGHHVYTNVHGADPDLPVKETGDIRRVTPFQTGSPLYRFQHIYLMVLYGLLGLKFRVQDVTGTILDGTNGTIRVNQQSAHDLFMQLVTKCVWVVWRILVPLYVFQCSHFDYWTTFFIAELMTGYYLAFNFQVSHVSPQAVWPDVKFPLSDEWAVNQLHTSIDYHHGNWLICFLSGALNYQSVHHLFPSVSQYHYPAIAPIVQRVCAKYGVRYNYLPTFRSAFLAHVEYLKQMGREGKEVHVHMG